jgi:hypothetical protein
MHQFGHWLRFLYCVTDDHKIISAVDFSQVVFAEDAPAWTFQISVHTLEEKKNETWICVMLYSLL